MMADPESISMELVMSNDDLLTEILVRLPALSLALFKSTSKRWCFLVKYAISLSIKDYAANLTFRRNLNPPCGLFLQKSRGRFSYNFVPLDVGIPICRSSFFNLGRDVEIFHSCNGLLLCGSKLDKKLYVNNPSINDMVKVLPQPGNQTYHRISYTSRLKLAFDPIKSRHYKVIFAERVNQNWVQIHTYSSETGNWTLCAEKFPWGSLVCFCDGVYWNNAIYWINEGNSDNIFKLDIKNEHPVLTDLQISDTVNVGYELFESGGCLLLVGKGNPNYRYLSIYEKRNEYSKWSLKYFISLNDIKKPFPKKQDSWKTLFCILFREREEDSFLVMKLDEEVVQYKIVSKTLSTICDVGPYGYLVSCFPFIPSFANV